MTTEDFLKVWDRVRFKFQLDSTRRSNACDDDGDKYGQNFYAGKAQACNGLDIDLRAALDDMKLTNRNL